MNILDENIPDDQRQLLQLKRIHTRKIGRDVGRKGMNDEEIIPLLHRMDRPTLFTHDGDFYQRRFCHAAYCLVFLDVDEEMFAEYIRRVLRHPAFNSKAKRMGRVIQVQPTGLTLWRVHEPKKAHLEW